MAIGNDKMLVLQERNSHFFVFQKNLRPLRGQIQDKRMDSRTGGLLLVAREIIGHEVFN
jgi:hypothetical protein